jgi:zinc transport system ATP-binding protein
MNEILKIEDLWFYYNQKIVLQGVNLSLREKDFLGIIGPNGGGKTTLLKLMLGLLQPYQGRILIYAEPPQSARRFVSYLAQKPAFEPGFPITVFETALMGKYRGLMKNWTRQDKRQALEALERVGMLKLKDELLGRLSGGEQQRVFLARALVRQPKILILDEPTTSVDIQVQKSFYDLLQVLNQEMTIILVSHDISVISSYVKIIACLNQELYFHDSKELSAADLEQVYQCPIEMIAHGVSHRVLKEH